MNNDNLDPATAPFPLDSPEIEVPDEIGLDDNNENGNEATAKKGPGRPRKVSAHEDTKKLLKLEEENKKLKKTNNNLKTTHGKELEDFRVSFNKMRRDIDDYQSSLEDCRSQLHDARRVIDIKDQAMDKYQNEIRVLNTQIDKLNTSLRSGEDALKEKSEEVSVLSGKLVEKIEENEELMNHVIQLTGDKSPAKPTRVKGYVVVDRVTERIIDGLSADIVWNKEYCALKDLVNNKTLLTKLKASDLVVIFSGCEEISNGENGIRTFNCLKTVTDELIKETMVVIVQLPLMLQKGESMQTNLFNFRLASLTKEIPMLQLIKPVSQLPKTALMNCDGLTMSDEGLSVWAQSINSEINIPKVPKPMPSTREASANCSDPDVTNFVPVPKESIGGLIGKKGHNIRELTNSFNVAMAIGKWMEKYRGSQDEFIEKTDAVLVSGKFSDVLNASTKIREIVQENKENKGNNEQLIKKVKF